MFDVTGKNPLLDIALELERIALEDEYFVTRKLYPNVDFYSGLIYQAMGFPVEMFPVLFAIPRTAGWIAQWEEMLLDPEQKIARPRQIYTGPRAARLRAAGQAGVNARCETRSAQSRLPVLRISGCRLLHWEPRLLQRSRSKSPATFDSSRAWEHLRSWSRSGRGRPDRRRSSRRADYIKDQLAAAGLTAVEQALDDRDAGRPVSDGEPHRHDSRRAARAHRHRRPLRHQAVQGHSGSSAPATAGRAPPSCSSSPACCKAAATR